MQLAGNPGRLARAQAVPRFEAPARGAGRALAWNAPASLLMAGLLLEIPLAHVPISKAARFLVLGVPQQGDTSAPLTLGVLFAPELLAVLGIGVLMLAGGHMGAPRHRGSFLVLAAASGLMVTGWAIALFASEFVVLSLTDGMYLFAGLLLGLLILCTRPSETTARFWTVALLSGVALTGLIGVYAYLGEVGLPSSLDQFGRARSLAAYDSYERATYGHANATSIVMSASLITALMLVISRRTHVIVRLLLAAIVVICAANLLFAFSRWGWVTTAAGLAAILVYSRDSFRAAWLVVPLILCMAFFGARVLDELGPYFEAALDERASSNLDRRLQSWQEGADAVALNPAGYGAQMVSRAPGLTASSSHNLFLDMALQNGIVAGVGMFVYVSVQAAWLWRFLRRPAADRDFAFALMLGAQVWVANQMFNGLFLIGASGMVWLGLWVGLSAISIASTNGAPGVAASEDAAVVPAPGAPARRIQSPDRPRP